MPRIVAAMRLVAPSAIAARIKARFDRLLLPGNASRASMARPNGSTRAAATPLSVDHGVSASSKLSSLIGRLHTIMVTFGRWPSTAVVTARLDQHKAPGTNQVDTAPSECARAPAGALRACAKYVLGVW